MRQYKEVNIILHSKTQDPFSRVPRDLLDSPDLSWKAKGILAYLIGKPLDWKVQISDLESRSKDGKDAIRSGLKELRDARYARLERDADDSGRIRAWRLLISDAPIFSPDSDSPDDDKPEAEKAGLEKPYISKKDSSKNESSKKEYNKGKAISEEEVVEYCASIGLTPKDGSYLWYNWESNGWTRNKQPIKNWRAAVKCWKNGGYLPSQQDKNRSCL